jgi:hypothetical protein
LPLMQAQYVAIFDGTALTISFTTASFEAKSVLPVFREIVGSLRLATR